MPRRGESIYKRKDGRWEARYIHHYENGKAKYRFLYGSSYAEVKAKRLEEQSLPQNAVITEPKRLITFEDLAALWLCEVRVSVKESTYARYHHIVTRYLTPKLGGQPISKLDIGYLKTLSQQLLEHGSTRGGALSAKTVTDILCVLKSILKYGEEQNYPCPDPNHFAYPVKKRHTAEILSAETGRQLEAVLWNAEDRVSMGILFALYTGVRIGELCGLRWEDIDLREKTATVRRTVERITDLENGAKSKTKVVIGEPKTEHSVRTIPLPSRLCEYLEHMVCEGDYYLLTGTAKHTEPHQFYLRYKTFMRKHGIDQYTFHALRHTFATRCIECGFDVKSLSEILGHANVTTTMAIYVHPTMEQKREQMERLTARCDL